MIPRIICSLLGCAGLIYAAWIIFMLEGLAGTIGRQWQPYGIALGIVIVSAACLYFGIRVNVQ
jgi:hypothetical protein